MIRKTAFLLLLIPLVVSGQPRRAKVPFPVYKKVEPERMINNLRDLASTAFEGRELGTDGNDKAVDWVSFKLEQTKIAPLFGSSFLQEFPIVRYDLGPANYFVLGNDSLHLYEDYLPAYYTTDAHIGANVVYAGFGYLSELKSYLKDRIVVMHGLRNEKMASSPYIQSDSINLQGLAAPLFYDQALWAQKMGAAAVIFVPEKDDFDLPFENGAGYQFAHTVKYPAKARKTMRHAQSPYVLPERLNISVLYATHEAGLRIMQTTEGVFNTLVVNARKGVVPAGQFFNRNVILGTQLKPMEKRFATNIGGIIHGKFGRPYLLVMANLDQEGQHPSLGYPYIGANNNASGISVMLELATILQAEEQPEYGIVFLIQNGAERDIAGLRTFVTKTPDIVSKIGGVMILKNLAGGPVSDSSSIYIKTTGRDSRFVNETEKAILDYAYVPKPIPYSGFYDVQELLPFHDRSIPVYELSSGTNTLSSRISDVPDKLNYVKMYRMTQFSLELIWRYNYVRNSALLNESH